ncbi:MAG TPA: hypothetical protein VGA37_05440 [Gemmatimonadales bacterium]
MKTVRDPAVLDRLIDRLNALRPETGRRWGTMSGGEMLCHLGDAAAGVLTPSTAAPVTGRRLAKWIGLRTALPWPHGLRTPRRVDPRADGTKPGDFASDRRRAIAGLRDIAAAGEGAMVSSHGVFGPMSTRDWQRWAYRHTNHHLRQFGL